MFGLPRANGAASGRTDHSHHHQNRRSRRSQRDRIRRFVQDHNSSVRPIENGFINPFLRPPICLLIITVPATVMSWIVYTKFSEVHPILAKLSRNTYFVLSIMNTSLLLLGFIWLYKSDLERKHYRSRFPSRKMTIRL
ncbi:Oidioi.mRNA.OKI2018_I69.chr2.g5835.t1.cds [Oikopleura dioica]|uniref:Oidioi.mRNA.OKI2018_I69.chr2.g5835.t1.cds n=1 Tax=Oikopleura dioica TaxID=34765 RepID=A0ABN7T5X5_OIKDI|nr:Oidioi.mRNA.OKI2018_I69.chr2.g5835.t1.cds [Oikopleura dioica]